MQIAIFRKYAINFFELLFPDDEALNEGLGAIILAVSFGWTHPFPTSYHYLDRGFLSSDQVFGSNRAVNYKHQILMCQMSHDLICCLIFRDPISHVMVCLKDQTSLHQNEVYKKKT